MPRPDFDWQEESPSDALRQDALAYSEVGGCKVLGATGGLARGGPTRLTVTRESLTMRLLFAVFLKLPGGRREYVFRRDDVTGLYLRSGLLHDHAVLRILHNVDAYARDVTYSSEHASALSQAFEQFGWDAGPDS